MHRLKYIKEKLLECVECQVESLNNVNTEELGEVIDMIKDLDEAIYYCAKTKKIMDEYESGETYFHHEGSLHYEHTPEEGKSGLRRKSYIEGKHMHLDKVKQIQELDAYMQELASDITEMIQDSTPEEKQLLQQKLAALATKIK